MQKMKQEEQRKFMTRTSANDLITERRQFFNRYTKVHQAKFQ
jgi:hypothetical protein